MQDNLKKFQEWYRRLPEKKHYVEFITAVLSVPVMLTVIIVNLNNLAQQKNSNQKQTNDSPAPIQVIITGDKQKESIVPQTYATQPVSTPTSSTCVKEVGPVSIISPRENEVILKDPVCITLSTESSYCPVEWSYQLNNGDWSDFSDKNICLHNLTNGDKVIQLKIKSTSSDDSLQLQRSFVYRGNAEPTAIPTVASSSATL